ncbi:LOW QUALITY PROTEIN: hypothetical protein PanWU01x14_169680 [Parasponia andersonii]|uniref:Uncharacterized protein n=1 Tax=Parasponia andersonii TaxID=3476 RepID=A0A2P5CAI3_PARAD|nr:LOW QUALITY PROTEIN: hypothetical protein PanWU01x14_169680 [Parasponia andersonii]
MSFLFATRHEYSQGKKTRIGVSFTARGISPLLLSFYNSLNNFYFRTTSFYVWYVHYIGFGGEHFRFGHGFAARSSHLR